MHHFHRRTWVHIPFSLLSLKKNQIKLAVEEKKNKRISYTTNPRFLCESKFSLFTITTALSSSSPTPFWSFQLDFLLSNPFLDVDFDTRNALFNPFINLCRIFFVVLGVPLHDDPSKPKDEEDPPIFSPLTQNRKLPEEFDPLSPLSILFSEP